VAPSRWNSRSWRMREFDVTPHLVSRYFGLRAFWTLFGIAC
jgi:hypothetical protein